MIKRTPEIRGKEGRPTALDEVIGDYLGSADPDLEKRVEGLIYETLQKSRPVYEIAKDLLRERFRRYDLDTKLINDRLIRFVTKSLEALISYVEQKKSGYLETTSDRYALYVSERGKGRDQEEQSGDEKSATRIRRKIEDTLDYIDRLILKESKEALKPEEALD